MITRFANRSRVSSLVACLSLAGVVACASEGDDPLGGRGGAATNNPTFDLRAVSPALSPTIVEGGSFAWSVNVSNTGTTRFENRTDPAVVRLQVSGNGTGTFSTGTGCDSFEPNVWLCQIVSLPVGDTRGYAINVVAGTVGTITVTATVSPLEDADPSNNTTTQVVQVTGLEPCPPPSACEEFTNNPRKRCEVAPKPAGTACEQVGCLAGVCDGKGSCANLASKCEAGDCTTSTCDATTNTCVVANKPDGQVCASSSQCGGNGRCEAGVCNGSDAIVCNDDNPCTTDSCEMGENRRYACQNVVKSCPGYGTCGDGMCNPQTGACEVAVDHARCDDGIACTDDVCTSSGCTNVPKHDRCSDSNLCDALLPVCDEDLGCIEAACRPRVHGDCADVQPKNCDDGNACTTDSCNPATGQCSNVAAACNDNNPCTVDACNPATGVCSSTPVSCDDGNACTIDSCDPVSGQCRHTPKNCDDGVACTADSCVNGVCVNTPRNADCSDGNACNGAEVCDPNQGCRPGTPVQCDDGNACTTDSCNPTTGACTHNPKSCDDGNACTTDSCDTVTGQCRHTTVNCDDGNACNGVEVCEPTKGCLLGHPLHCDDGNRCNGAETCDPAHGCRPGTPVTCDDGNACTVDSCDSATGECRNTLKNCDDGNACTIDSCDLATGQCRNVAKNCDDGVACTVDSCVDGTCVNTPRNDLCSDNDLCNGVETCDATQGCKAGEPKNCNDGNACTTDSCNPTTGQCSNTAVTCNDNNPCTVDSCNPTTGQCQFQAKSCDDGNACTIDSCDVATGQCRNVAKNCDDGVACTVDSCVNGACVNAPQNDLCSDNNLCNGVETCDATRGCQAGTPKNCNDDSVCTTDACNPTTGQCSNTPVSCDDGNACTIDSCDPVQGCRHTPKSCDDGIACTADSCVNGVCVNTPTPSLCSDGNVCNGAETCDAQRGCVAGTPLTCDDGNVCTTDSCDPVRGCVAVNNTNPCDDGNACNNACLEWDVEPAAAWTVTNYQGGNHGFWLPGFNGGNGVTYLTLHSDTKLAWWDDGSATLTGTAEVTHSAGNLGLGDRYAIEMYFSYRGAGPAGEGSGGPKLSDLVDYEDTLGWQYFDLTSGFLFGIDDASDFVSFEQYPDDSRMPFQLGVGANDKTLGFGAATWMTFDRSYAGGVSAGIGDFNVDLQAYECPTHDMCVNGACVGRGPVVCDDGDQCTTESCDPSEGCVSQPYTGPCNDGNACTTNDTCGGTCSGTPVVCDDDDACTTDTCDPSVGCLFIPIPDCGGDCPICTGVSRVTLKVDAWSGSRDPNEVVRVRQNGASGAVLYSGVVGNGGTFEVNLPLGTNSISVTVQGNLHPTESEKATFAIDCAAVVGQTNGNAYMTFKVVHVKQRVAADNCDDGDACTTDECTATGCVNTPIAGCGLCPECIGVQRVTLKVTAWAGNRDTNETVRIRKNSTSGAVLWSGKIANNGSVTVDLPTDTTKIVLTVQGNSHPSETEKASFTTNCALAVNASNGNSYITFKVTDLVQRTRGVSCDDNDPCTADECTATGCVNTPIPYCGLCPECVGVQRVTVKVTSWAGNRDTNETVRIRKNSASGTKLYEGKIANNGSVTIDLPTDTTSIVLTVKGTAHTTETQKASFTTNCALAAGKTDGNSYIGFTITSVVQRTEGVSCDDGDECTTDQCTANGCTHTEIAGCRLCPVCEGVSRVTAKVTSWYSTRDTNETVRIRKNSKSGAILWSGKIANNGSVTLDLPNDTTKLVFTVQGNYHSSETEKASFTTNCALANGAVNGNSYIKFTLTSVIKRTVLGQCN